MTIMTRIRLAHTPYLDAWLDSLRAATDGHRGISMNPDFQLAHPCKFCLRPAHVIRRRCSSGVEQFIRNE